MQSAPLQQDLYPGFVTGLFCSGKKPFYLFDEEVDFIGPAVKVRHQTDVWCVQIDQDSRVLEMRLKWRRSTFRKPGEHHVGLNRTGINRDLRQFSKHFGEAKRIGMIFGEAFDMMVKRINRSGGENADLAHTATYQFTDPMRTADHVL